MFGMDKDAVRQMFGALRKRPTMDPLGALKDKHFGGIDQAEDTMAEIESLMYSAFTANDQYRMISLGAAPGEWAVRAERAYFNKNPSGNFKSYCFEADLEHVKMIDAFMERNGVNKSNHVITYAAAAGMDGFAYFPIINPEKDWGAGIAAISESPDDLDEKITITESTRNDRIAANGGKPLSFRTVKALSLATILNEIGGTVDYVHCDIQGAERDVFPAALDALSKHARICCVATHGTEIEKVLSEAFEQHGWTLECNYARRPGRDGTFIWSNSRSPSSSVLGNEPKAEPTIRHLGIREEIKVTPIAIMSFNRPEYLKEVLSTLKAQVPAASEDRIFLFQDGYKSISGADLTDPALIEASIAEFKAAFPNSTVFADEKNLGVAMNFNRAEEYFFVDRNAESALFFEDDLILSPYYLTAVEALLKMAMEDPKIAYVAAYGDHRASLEAQRKTPGKIVMMRHKWGFGLTKRQWLRQKPILQPYLEIIARRDYKSRDSSAIRAYYKRLGFGSPGTSQDAMKDVASAILGTVKVMTQACFGKNIGVTGLHSKAEFYEKEGFGQTELYPEPVSDFDQLSSHQIDTWVAETRKAAEACLSEQ